MTEPYSRIKIEPTSGALGAEISGVNLAALDTLDDETFDEIQRAWLEYQVVFFRDQRITPAVQAAFA